MNATELNEKIHEIGIVPVIKLANPERDAKDLAKALVEGGVPVAEVTFRAEGADKAIKLMKEAYPDMLVGSGTVTNKDQIDKTIEAGGEFIVTPGFDADLVEYAQEKGIPIYPGCSSASDYHQAVKHGLEVVKFFPAEQAGGLPMIKALSAPFSMLKVMPTGGINLNNLESYISEPVITACGGSYMVSDKLINNQEWDEITKICKETKDLIKEVRDEG